jgi:hypothetical protein
VAQKAFRDYATNRSACERLLLTVSINDESPGVLCSSTVWALLDRVSATLISTAAALDQIMARTYDDLRHRDDIPVFTPRSIDILAVDLIRDAGALELGKEKPRRLAGADGE